MIRLKVTSNTKPIEDLAAFAGDFVRLSNEMATRAFDRIESDFLDELRYYPAPPPNSTYVRTFTLRDGWTLRVEEADGGFALVIENDTPYSKYVVGSLAKARSAAAALQADVHRGRWPLAKDTVDFWQAAFFELYNEEFARELSRFGTTSTSQRAFTR